MTVTKYDTRLLSLCYLSMASACNSLPVQEPIEPMPVPYFHTLTQQMSDPAQSKPLTFLQQGPYGVAHFPEVKIALQLDRILSTDVYLAAHAEKAPLILIQHGNESTKESHASQAWHLATWGFNVISVGQVKRGQWIQNGKNLRDLVALIKAWPALIDESCDLNRIILMGHSFGGSAVSIAAANNPSIKGLVLLDPALYQPHLLKTLNNVTVPTILLGADRKVFLSKQRRAFFKNIPAITEVSVVDATHNDAQMPSQRKIDFLFDFTTHEQKQRLFMALLTYSIFQLSYAEYPLQLFANIDAAHFLKETRTKSPASKFSLLTPPGVDSSAQAHD